MSFRSWSSKQNIHVHPHNPLTAEEQHDEQVIVAISDTITCRWCNHARSQCDGHCSFSFVLPCVSRKRYKKAPSFFSMHLGVKAEVLKKDVDCHHIILEDWDK